MACVVDQPVPDRFKVLPDRAPPGGVPKYTAGMERGDQGNPLIVVEGAVNTGDPGGSPGEYSGTDTAEGDY